VKVRRTAVTPPGHVIAIDQEGMPLHNTPSETGKLYIHFTVAFPESITDEQAKLFKQALSQ
jgi:DnaJ-class molecular chaperone